ncbi:MAG: hypothetical protein KKE11_06070 [Gammaproteobacteria bacterium]|nr:hypothetical protein [Gammaproteobacteria bacterium]
MLEDSLISNVWTQRSLGIDLSKNLTSVKNSDVEYLCNYLYPFLQLVNSSAIFTDETPIKFITSAAGWIIHDYGEAVSVSAPHDINANQGQDEESGLSYKNGGGVMGQIATSYELANLIATKGWNDAELIAGTPLMKRFIWIDSKRYGFELHGYTPEAGDERCFERLHKQAQENGEIWELAKPKVENLAGAE